MSCPNCESETAIETFVRVGRASVMIVGCSEHLKELLEIYNRGLKAKPNATLSNLEGRDGDSK